MPKDDFGIENMMAVIECRAALMTQQGQTASQIYIKTPLPPLDPVDEILFGRTIDLESLHPRVRDIYAGGFKQLEEMDKACHTFILVSRMLIQGLLVVR
jgi:hypothetical protein